MTKGSKSGGLLGFYGNVEGSKTKISPLEVTRRTIIKNIKKNDSKYPKVRNHNFYGTPYATMSGKKNINFYYTIDGYPSSIPMDFKRAIRREALSGVRVSFISTFEPTRIDWSSPQMKSKMRVWRSIDNDREAVDEYNYVDNVGAMDVTYRRKASLLYLADADKRRRRNMFKYRTLMIVSGVRGEAFDKSIKEIEEYCKNQEIVITRVDSNIDEFLKAFSPFTMELTNGVLSSVGSNTLPDEQLARFSGYNQGKIGKEGVMFGSDIYSGFPVYKQFKKHDTDAETILITAETGGGKSYLLKSLLAQLIGDPKYNGTINDIEGFEYIPFGAFLANNSKVVIINMAEGQGCYYDPFEIELTGDPQLDEDMFNLSKNFTSSYMSVLIGQKLLEENIWASKIVNNAISRAYSDAGVLEEDMSTWVNTKGKDGLFYVYSKFKELYEEYFDLVKRGTNVEDLNLYDRYKLNPGYVDALDKVVAKLSEYFEPLENGGIRSNVFKKKVTLREIIEAKLVINSFGMAGKTAESVDKTQMSLSQLSAANISYIRSIFSKALGKYNFKVWEEFQRWGAFPGSDNTIKTAVTGGRKLGDVNFIVTNNVKELLDDDRFAIFDNVSSFAIGAIASEETRARLCKQLSVPLLKPDLDAIVTKRSSGKEDSDEVNGETAGMYDKAFMVHLDKSVSTIVKVFLPKHISRSNIFKTGVDLKG